MLWNRFLDAISKLSLLPLARQQKKLLRERSNYTRNLFIDDLRYCDDGEVSGATWDVLVQDASFVEGFKPSPKDDFEVVYGLADEDTDETIEKIFERSGRKFPDEDTLKVLKPNFTVGDVVEFVASCEIKDKP